MVRGLQAAALGAAVAAVAYWRRALTLDGAVMAAVVGGVTYARGGPPAAGSLLAFFSSSSALSRLGEKRKSSSPLAQAKGARRDAAQVLANGGWASLCFGCGLPEAGIGALSAAGADTWATELGMLARRRPRLITTLKEVPVGTSGGVTIEALAAGLGGALMVGLAWWLLGGARRGVLVAAAAGSGGCVVDSFLGATVQALYRCAHCGAYTEHPTHASCGTAARLVRGQRWISNDTVNALATLSGALIGRLLQRCPRPAGAAFQAAQEEAQA